MKSFAIFVSGRGSNMTALLQKHQDGQLSAVPKVVFSNQSSAPALNQAKKYGIATRSLSHKNFNSRVEFDTNVVGLLAEFDLDFIVLAGYMRIVSPVLLEAFPNAVINIHPALLPSFPGVDAVKQALNYGVKIAGCTVHFVDEQMDHGPIIVQKSIPVGDVTDLQTLQSKILEQEHQALVEAVELFALDRLRIVGRRVSIL